MTIGQSYYLKVSDTTILTVNALILGLLIYESCRLTASVRPTSDFAGMIPIEELTAVSSLQSKDTEIQNTEGGAFQNGRWQDNKQLLVKGTEAGDSFAVEIPSGDCAGACILKVFFTKAGDYGIVSVFVDGIQVGKDVDLYSPVILSTGPVEIGKLNETAAVSRVLEFRVLGTSKLSKSPHYQFGIDGILLVQP